ncbi:MAG TPA: MetS family NSS transporter small subunit [Bacteroidetes bacterium]|nr:MetS family NSS transporter small subunit [Bacteroidota bacterium]
MMPVSAWIMLILGCVVLYGGFIWSLRIALRNRKDR